MQYRHRPLGTAQLRMLSTLELNGGVWFDGCGWAVKSRSQTIQILETLVKRGNVVVVERMRPRLNGVVDTFPVYKLPWIKE